MVVKESIARDVLRLIVWYPLRWLLLSLPMGLGIMVLRTMGDIHYALSKGRKGQILSNLQRANVPQGEAMAAVREYMRLHYIDRLLIFIFPKMGKREVGRYVEITGLEHIDKAIGEGRGVVLVHGHFGPVHLPLVALARLGYRMKQIGLPSDEGLSWIGRNVAFRLRMKYEGMMPAKIIKADGFLRDAFKWLSSGGVVMITGDGSGTEKRLGRHALYSFLGQPVMFPLGPALLAAKADAALIPMFIMPGKDKPYRIVIESPISTGGSAVDAGAATGDFVGRYEARVRECPGYMHFIDRFSPGMFIEAS